MNETSTTLSRLEPRAVPPKHSGIATVSQYWHMFLKELVVLRLNRTLWGHF
jgi:hypothetical protein